MPLSAVELYGLFQNIDACAQEKVTELEPTLDGKFLYTNRDIVGKAYGYLYKWIYALSGSNDYRSHLLRGAMLYASFSSVKLIDFYWTKYEDYQKEVVKRLQGIAYDNAAFSEARWHLTRYDTTIRHTYKRIQKYPENYRELFEVAFRGPVKEEDCPNFAEKGALAKFPFMPIWLENIFQKIYGIFRYLGRRFDEIIGKNYLTPAMHWLTTPGITLEEQKYRAKTGLTHRFDCDSRVRTMENFLPIIRLEIASELDFPLEEFVKIFKSLKRTDTEEKKLEDWYAKISKWNHPNAFGLLDECLNAVHRALVDVAPLESVEYLIFYNSKDKKQTSWKKKNVLPQAQLVCGKDAYTVESEKATVEESSYYSLTDNPHRLLRIPPNKRLFAFERMARCDVELETLETYYEDPANRFSIVEAPKSNLLDNKWKSDDLKLHQEDISVIEAIGKIVKDFQDMEKIPLKMHPLQFCVCLDNSVKAWSLPSMEDYNYYTVLDFLTIASQNKPTVYQALIKESQIENHKISRYYADLIEEYLSQGTFQNNELAEKHGVDVAVIRKGFEEKIKIAVEKLNKMHGQGTEALINAKNKLLEAYKNSKLILDLPELIS